MDARDPHAKDEDVVEAHAKNLPPALRLAAGPDLKKFLLAVILRERARCAGLAIGHAEYHKREGRGQAAMALANFSQELTIPPGACRRCRGRKMVAAGIVTAGGQPLGVPCPDCSSETTPASAPSA